MPSKKRKYNARFPAGRIKKIMQTDEEVGKVAQAVPIIISRTLELFVESLLSKAMRVTMARNAKTLSPSHVKQCILAEARFDFLRDLVQNIPDASEEKDHSADDSPNASRPIDAPASVPPRRLNREDSSSSCSSEVRPRPPRDLPTRSVSLDPEIHRPRSDAPATIVSTDTVIDLSLKPPQQKTVRTANFYQETLPDEVQHHSVITPNPTYASPQPSTSNYANLTPVPCRDIPVPKPERRFYVDTSLGTPPTTPITPVLNIDFSKNLAKPEIKVLGATASNIVPNEAKPRIHRQNSRTREPVKKVKPVSVAPSTYVDLDNFSTGNLQIDEDYDT